MMMWGVRGCICNHILVGYCHKYLCLKTQYLPRICRNVLNTSIKISTIK
ncbi:hypothetical protein [Moraxella lacunata]